MPARRGTGLTGGDAAHLLSRNQRLLDAISLFYAHDLTDAYHSWAINVMLSISALIHPSPARLPFMSARASSASRTGRGREFSHIATLALRENLWLRCYIKMPSRWIFLIIRFTPLCKHTAQSHNQAQATSSNKMSTITNTWNTISSDRTTGSSSAASTFEQAWSSHVVGSGGGSNESSWGTSWSSMWGSSGNASTSSWGGTGSDKNRSSCSW